MGAPPLGAGFFISDRVRAEYETLQRTDPFAADEFVNEMHTQHAQYARAVERVTTALKSLHARRDDVGSALERITESGDVATVAQLAEVAWENFERQLQSPADLLAPSHKQPGQLVHEVVALRAELVRKQYDALWIAVVDAQARAAGVMRDLQRARRKCAALPASDAQATLRVAHWRQLGAQQSGTPASQQRWLDGKLFDYRQAFGEWRAGVDTLAAAERSLLDAGRTESARQQLSQVLQHSAEAKRTYDAFLKA